MPWRTGAVEAQPALPHALLCHDFRGRRAGRIAGGPGGAAPVQRALRNAAGPGGLRRAGGGRSARPSGPGVVWRPAAASAIRRRSVGPGVGGLFRVRSPGIRGFGGAPARGRGCETGLDRPGLVRHQCPAGGSGDLRRAGGGGTAGP